jgi:ubiquitin C-terminal hydrolase
MGAFLQCYSSFFPHQQLSGDNAVKCPCCKRATAHQTICRVDGWPSHLVISFKRLVYDSVVGGLRKIMTPLLLDLDGVDPTPFGGQQYSVSAVIAHGGHTIRGGHNWSAVRFKGVPSGWVCVNDAVVFELAGKEILHGLFLEQFAASVVYCIVLAKKKQLNMRIHDMMRSNQSCVFPLSVFTRARE